MFTKDENYYRLVASNGVRFLVGDAGEEQHLSIYINHGSFHIYLTDDEAKSLAEMLLTSVKEKAHV